jgi:hypothetical protein
LVLLVPGKVVQAQDLICRFASDSDTFDLHQSHSDEDKGEDQQNVDKAAQGVGSRQTECPEYNEEYD